MKKLLLTTALILVLGTSFGQKIENGSVLAFHVGTTVLHPDVTMNQVLDFSANKWIPAWEKAYPGLKVFIIKGDRGEFIHQHCNFTLFESKALRDKFWPEESEAGPYDETASKILEPLQKEWSELVIGGKGTATDWEVLPVNASAPAPLTKGVVLGTHLLTVDLDPDVTMNQYLNFLAKKYIPEWEKNFPGWRFFLLRGDRGDFKDRYMFLVWVESVETRDKYATEGGYTDAGKAAMEKLQPLFEESENMAKWSSAYTDWIIL